MPANYPSSLPTLKTNFADGTPHDEELSSKGLNQPNLEINAIATELGTSPKAAALEARASSASAVVNLLGQLKQAIKDIAGTTNWYDALPATLTSLFAKFHASSGHGHTGGAGDSPQIAAGGLATNAVTTVKIEDSAVSYLKVAAGFIVQVVETLSSAVATGSTQIPLDDTIPQNTEGDEYMTVTITPKSTTNILVIDAIVTMSNATNGRNIIAALFKDSVASALAASDMYGATGTEFLPLPLHHSMVAGTTSPITFKVRAGSNDTGTNTFNGTGGARRFGGITTSFIRVMEYKA